MKLVQFFVMNFTLTGVPFSYSCDAVNSWIDFSTNEGGKRGGAFITFLIVLILYFVDVCCLKRKAESELEAAENQKIMEMRGSVVKPMQTSQVMIGTDSVRDS